MGIVVGRTCRQMLQKLRQEDREFKASLGSTFQDEASDWIVEGLSTMLSPRCHRTKPELVLNSGPQRTSEQPPAAEPLLATINILTVAISK